MRIAIVDDEEKWRHKVYSIVKSHFDNYDLEVKCYSSGEGFLHNVCCYDIVLMDIEMYELDGFDTTSRYREMFPESVIIILTTHTDLSRKGYLVNAFRYIDKTNIEEEIKEALFSAEKIMERNKKIQINIINYGKRELVIKDILYFETYGRKVMVHTVRDRYECSNNIGELEKQLVEYGFYKTHKSYLINLDAIKSIDAISKNSVIMKDGSEVYSSSRKYWELKRKYAERIFESANA